MQLCDLLGVENGVVFLGRFYEIVAFQVERLRIVVGGRRRLTLFGFEYGSFFFKLGETIRDKEHRSLCEKRSGDEKKN